MAVLCLTASDRAGEFLRDLELKGPEPTISLGKCLNPLWYEICSEVFVLKESAQSSGNK